jgi:serralysin
MAWNFVFGTGASERINGADGVTNGDDFILGYNGSDIIYGQKGNDWLLGGAGADFLDGGQGLDTAAYTGSGAAVFVALENNGGYGSGYGGDAQGDTLFSIENLTGSGYADTLMGNEGRNTLTGLSGDDTLKGYGGSDVLEGGEGNDTLWGMGGSEGAFGANLLLGQSGDDTLHGGDDHDLLDGGTGRDVLEGGEGADRFSWLFITETGNTQTTADVITDFDPEEDDRISLGEIDADVYAAGNQEFTFIGMASFTGTPGEINYYHDGGNTYIQLQTGTSADVEGMIRLDGIHTPEASWFYL